MLRLELAGPDTLLLSSLCARCPQGPVGCCASPPDLDWSSLARVVAHGGAAWLLQQIAAKDLVPSPRGLALRRARLRFSPTEARRSRCVFHGPSGCTIAHERRPMTCNYFLCDDAHGERDAGGRADQLASAARREHEALKQFHAKWNRSLAEQIAAEWPEGPPWDASFLEWIGARWSARLE